MTNTRPTALVADDEPLLREALIRQLGVAWPDLRIVAEARNGKDAIRLFDLHHPDVCFLDIRMPGLSGIDVAQAVQGRSHVVFVTAYDDYAVQAFAHAVLDYLVKPVELSRLIDTVARVKARLGSTSVTVDMAEQLRQLSVRLDAATRPAEAPLKWLSAQIGQTLKMIPVESIDYLRSDARYTRVAWHDDAGHPREAILTMSLKELAAKLDPTRFLQVHRSVLVNVHAVSHVVRAGNETAEIHLRSRQEILPVSRAHVHLFRAM
ncbi:DNA-binding LytR/AlgR family response regulator [Luteibacter sp. Sphag1AF]|uniref:LytR/AlgR family response regulator transcription factor n=1 Tax=Luteibacter sp. Sphag1AF TaxID=2587031 RepID=UPI00161D6B4F|nr:LytTR family DNA-binding domain-containing protein [Luteibacter sp. Sphag1AF]MBB3226353.1 DNA-binding LytR/AlgR family response regulator [Luteibacter sp. Sphag1AF]